jgi:hypothetical protein
MSIVNMSNPNTPNMSTENLLALLRQRLNGELENVAGSTEQVNDWLNLKRRLIGQTKNMSMLKESWVYPGRKRTTFE